MGKQRKRNRLQFYDYSNNGWYFVTICTKQKRPWFGEVVDGKMILNEIGNITSNHWNEIPSHYKNVELDEYVIMPNHIHGIIIVTENHVGNGLAHSSIKSKNGQVRSLRPNLSNIIGGFKAGVSREIRGLGLPFIWQRSFYDRIIRNESELLKIRKYIKLNPLKSTLHNEMENLSI